MPLTIDAFLTEVFTTDVGNGLSRTCVGGAHRRSFTETHFLHSDTRRMQDKKPRIPSKSVAILLNGMHGQLCLSTTVGLMKTS